VLTAKDLDTLRRLKVPPKGPTDAAVYVALLTVLDCDQGTFGDDDPDTLWACDTARRERYPVPLVLVDELVTLGWLDDGQGYDVLAVTERGKWWLGKFLKANGGQL
jgi:hypothetical protein